MKKYIIYLLFYKLVRMRSRKKVMKVHQKMLFFIWLENVYIQCIYLV